MLIRQKIGDQVITAVQLPAAPRNTVILENGGTAVIVSPAVAESAAGITLLTPLTADQPDLAAWLTDLLSATGAEQPGAWQLSVVGPPAPMVYPLIAAAISIAQWHRSQGRSRLLTARLTDELVITQTGEAIVGLHGSVAAGAVLSLPEWPLQSAWQHFTAQVVTLMGGTLAAEPAMSEHMPLLQQPPPTITRPTPATVYAAQGDAAGIFWATDTGIARQQLAAGSAWPAVVINGTALLNTAIDTVWAGWHQAAGAAILTRHAADQVHLRWQSLPLSAVEVQTWWQQIQTDDAALHRRLMVL
ncbi:hypothetical protein [Schleiferilactobacillus harbinensis]|uniref:hypothetical protein n=1 Tax=Schleiferilactobacillus harbinensis TaxID=304207 RepID=UPI0039EA011F